MWLDFGFSPVKCKTILTFLSANYFPLHCIAQVSSKSSNVDTRRKILTLLVPPLGCLEILVEFHLFIFLNVEILNEVGRSNCTNSQPADTCVLSRVCNFD